MQVQKEGTDVTLVGYGKMVGYNLDAAEELQKDGISCEVGLPQGWHPMYRTHVMKSWSHMMLHLLCEGC